MLWILNVRYINVSFFVFEVLTATLLCVYIISTYFTVEEMEGLSNLTIILS